MHTLTRNPRQRTEEGELTQDFAQHPRFSHATWVAISVAAVGAGTSIYGASQQRVANNKAADANQKAQADQNAAAWSNYLMSRGLNPAGAQTGQIPQNAQAINQRLPLWANVRPATGIPAQPSARPASPFIRRKAPIS